MTHVQHREPTDGNLIELIARGDRPAFEELYRRYARTVLGLALRRLGDRGRAEDAAQDAFLAIWRSARTYDARRGSGAPWVYAVARNAIIDGLRRTPEPAAGRPRGARRRPRSTRSCRGRLAGLAGAPGTRGPPRARTAGDRARVLARPLAERDRRLARYTPRYGEDPHAKRSLASRPGARRDARMRTKALTSRSWSARRSTRRERERLLRVHNALLQAGPPPELSSRFAAAPTPTVVPLNRRRRRAGVLALAAAFGVGCLRGGVRRIRE